MKAHQALSAAEAVQQTQPLKTWDLYQSGLQLKICAESREPDALLVGNIRAGDLLALAQDYVRLRLQAGIDDAPTETLSNPETGWLPIESAPRDGSEVDLWTGPHGRRSTDCWWDQEYKDWRRYWIDAFGSPGTTGIGYYPATHWRPIPGAPK